MSEPGFDDLADTITANLRTMKEASAQLEALTGSIYTILTLSFIICVFALFALWKATK